MRTPQDSTQVKVTAGGVRGPAAGPAAIRRCDHALSDLFAARGQLHLLDNPTQAIADLTQAIQLNTDNARTHYYRSLAHAAAGNGDAAHTDGETAARLDPSVQTLAATHGQLDSGYRVIALYNSGGEDHRPLAHFPLSPAGLRRAINHAQKMGRDGGARSMLDNRYQVDDDDFTTVVQEYHLTVRDVLAVPSQDGGLVLPLPDRFHSDAHDRVKRALPVPTPGYWPCWDTLFDDPQIAKHDLTEDDVVVASRQVEAKVRQLISDNLSPLSSASQRLPSPAKVFQAILDVCYQPEKNVTAKNVLRYLREDEDIEVDDLTKFLTELNAAKQRVAEAVIAANQKLLERLPETTRDGFAQDLSVFTCEELLKALAEQASSNSPQTEPGTAALSHA